MKKLILASGIFLGLFFIQPAQAKNMSDTTIDNQLTQQEISGGWKLLFDGKTMNGWRTFKNQPGSWQIDSGMLCSKTADAGHADLITDSEYENFELSVDWKISPEGNSGIMYLVNENFDETYLSGPEYQLIDDDGYPEKIAPDQHTGSNYAMQPPAVNATKKPGEWNTSKIVVNNGHVEHWLNGKKVVEYTLWSNAWKKEKAAGKWKDVAGYGASKNGHIAFQSSHNRVATSGICFKNIKIKLL
ncbi:MAG: DUF1080 domain-containing protein [Bacteroidetes bacterium]|nr:DUF1080 domain-containing protein [Bacteroidota bacterium]